MIVSMSSDNCTLPLINLNTLINLKVLNGDRVRLIPNSDAEYSSIISTRLIMTITRSKMLNYSEQYNSKPNATILTMHSAAKIVVKR